MYNFKANSISTIIPSSVSNKYPMFESFLSSYYYWQQKTTITLEGSIGNVGFSDYLYGSSSEFSTSIEVNVETNKSIITEFDSKNTKTFIRGENAFAYTRHNEPVVIELDKQKRFLFNGELEPKIIFFRGQTYFFENKTGQPFYIKDRKTAGANNALDNPRIDNNGAASGVISIEINERTPRLLYYTTSLTSTSIGTFDIQTATTQLRIDIVNSGLENVSVWGYSIVKEMLFHPEYLYDNFNKLSTIDTPDAYFLEYLSKYGLESFFRDNFKNRRAISDFIRFFQKKGTEDAIKFFFRNFFDRDVSLSYPGDLVLKSSNSKYFIREQLYVSATPKGVEFTRNRRIKGEVSGASAIIEAYSFDAGRDFYKLFLDKDKIIGEFHIDEQVLVIDDNDSSIEYDTGGRILGTVAQFDIVEPGEGYQVDETITNTYTVAGEPLIVTLNVRDVTSSSIEQLSIETLGSGYKEGEELLFAKPEKKTQFYGVVQEQPGTGLEKYQSYNIGFVFYGDYEDYTLDYNGATTSIAGIQYTIDDYDESTEILDLQEAEGAPTVESGTMLFLDFPAANVGDPYYDESFFHVSNREAKREARGFISSVTESGAIESINISNNGRGYTKKPSTENGGIFLFTESGTGAEIYTQGQGFGGILEVENENDIIGTSFDIVITLQRGSTAKDKDARIRFRTSPTSKYGNFFEDNSGFLSDEIYIHDSYYYQDYSYVIRSDLNFSEFAQLFQNLAHPAGLIFFNQYFIINYFDQRINNGEDAATSPLQIRLEKLPSSHNLNIDFTLVTLQTISQYINYLFRQQLKKQFHWYSETLLSFWNEYDLTYSGTTISGFSDWSLSDTALVPREFDENPIDHIRTIHLFTTVSGAGTLSYVDTTESGQYSTFFTVSGDNSLFTTETSKYDMLNVENELLMVYTVNTDTELVAQRLNIDSAVSVTGVPYTITQKQKTELHNANTVDILQQGDVNTLGDVDITDRQVQYIDDLFLNT